MRRSPVVALLSDLAVELRLALDIEPTYGFVARLSLPDGRQRYLRATTFDLNPAGATEIANDKAYASYFLERLGYPVPEGEAFFTREWCTAIASDRDPDRAWAFAQQLRPPVIVKPNSKSQGMGVTLVHNRREFFKAVAAASRLDRVYLVQRHIAGQDFRIVLLDGEIISAYERLPLAVVGDGRSTIAELLKEKQVAFEVSGRDTKIDLNDPRIVAVLSRNGYTLTSTPPNDAPVRLLPVANLSTGGDACDVTTHVHPAWHELTAAVARDMNLRYIGLDVISATPLSESPTTYTIIEINAAPGLDNYASIGPSQEARVRDLYRRVLRAMVAS
jgi:D-alanine-D-alanine ligase-like ATP-grasp enzyme